MKPRRIVFPGPRQVAVEEFAPVALGAGQVRVRTRFSLMSTGTENILFNRLFAAGSPWDEWLQYPFFPGYSAVGTVTEVGEGVDSVRLGDPVGLRYGHASEHVASVGHVLPIPPSLPLDQAVWFSLGKIAFQGARVAPYALGETLLVIGAGPIGQMSVRWAAAAGMGRIVVVDPVEARLAHALRGGATHAVARPVEQCRDEVLAACDGALPRIVNDATGNAEVFSAALGLAAKYGRVVVLGDTGTPAEQRLTADVILRGLSVVGAHDTHNDDRWNNATITRLFFDLVTRGRFPLEGLNTHVFLPGDAVAAYATANARRGETMGVLFDWGDEGSLSPGIPARAA